MHMKNSWKPCNWSPRSQRNQEKNQFGLALLAARALAPAACAVVWCGGLGRTCGRTSVCKFGQTKLGRSSGGPGHSSGLGEKPVRISTEYGVFPPFKTQSHLHKRMLKNTSKPEELITSNFKQVGKAQASKKTTKSWTLDVYNSQCMQTWVSKWKLLQFTLQIPNFM